MSRFLDNEAAEADDSDIAAEERAIRGEETAFDRRERREAGAAGAGGAQKRAREDDDDEDAEFDPEQTNADEPGWFEPARLLAEVGRIDRLLPDNEQQRQWQRTVRRVAAAIMLTRLYVDGRYSPVDHPTDWMRENEDEIARVFLQIVLAPRDHAEGEGE